MSLTGKRVLVTGGTRGIGLGIVEGFVSRGATVVFSGRDQQLGERVSINTGAQFVAADLRVAHDVSNLVAQCVESVGGLDILCHNAGVYPEHTLESMTDESWHDVLDTNLTSAMMLVRAAHPHLVKAGSGRVVLISSITGPRTAIPALTHYAASKAGLEGFARAAAVELAPHGITVNCVAPGTILTEGLAQLYSEPGVMDEVVGRIPAGRIGTPADIAAAVTFLADQDSGFITGQSIIVDGGQTLPEVQS